MKFSTNLGNVGKVKDVSPRCPGRMVVSRGAMTDVIQFLLRDYLVVENITQIKFDRMPTKNR